jgi:hypothetical protein
MTNPAARPAPEPVNVSTLIADLSAAAISLRVIRSKLAQLVAHGHAAVTGSRGAATILIDGLSVAESLETLASQLGAPVDGPEEDMPF